MTMTKSFTVDVDAELLEQARTVLGEDGTRDATESGLREAIDRELERRAIQDMIDIDLDPAPTRDNIES